MVSPEYVIKIQFLTAHFWVLADHLNINHYRNLRQQNLPNLSQGQLYKQGHGQCCQFETCLLLKQHAHTSTLGLKKSEH